MDIEFYPREARRYHETIPFEINGLSTMNVEIFGEGTDMKVMRFLSPICTITATFTLTWDFVTDFSRFLNSRYLCHKKPKNNGPFLLKIARLEH